MYPQANLTVYVAANNPNATFWNFKISAIIILDKSITIRPYNMTYS